MSKQQANLFVITAPSGAGKTSLVRMLVTSLDQLEISVSYTTRQPRIAEVHGRDYFFVNEEIFKEMQQRHEFLESAYIYGYHYGTTWSWVETKLSQGIDVILEIDWQGAYQIHDHLSLGKKALFIFILPPSIETLYERLRKRGQDEEEVISRRIAGARLDIEHLTDKFDYILVNNDFDRALLDLQHIVCAERLSYKRQLNQQDLLLQQLLKK